MITFRVCSTYTLSNEFMHIV